MRDLSLVFFLYLIYIELRREASGCILPLTIIIIIPPPSRRRRRLPDQGDDRNKTGRTLAHDAPHVFVIGKGQQGDRRHDDGDGWHNGRRHDDPGKGLQTGGTTTVRAADHGDRSHPLSYDGFFDAVLVSKTRDERGVPVPEEGESVWLFDARGVAS